MCYRGSLICLDILVVFGVVVVFVVVVVVVGCSGCGIVEDDVVDFVTDVGGGVVDSCVIVDVDVW